MRMIDSVTMRLVMVVRQTEKRVLVLCLLFMVHWDASGMIDVGLCHRDVRP